MRRNYNREQYIEVIHRAVNAIPNLGLGADVIVGFPGETDAAFENTRKLIEELPFSYLHIFSYSQGVGQKPMTIKMIFPEISRKSGIKFSLN